MSKESYIRGFCKAAEAIGVDPVKLAAWWQDANLEDYSKPGGPAQFQRDAMEFARRGDELRKLLRQKPVNRQLPIHDPRLEYANYLRLKPLLGNFRPKFSKPTGIAGSPPAPAQTPQAQPQRQAPATSYPSLREYMKGFDGSSGRDPVTSWLNYRRNNTPGS